MKMKMLKLPEKIMLMIVKLPQNETGHRNVKVSLKNGDILNNKTIINSEVLILDDYEELNINEIEKIESEEVLQII